MDFYYDSAHFIAGLSPMVTAVSHLPASLAGFAAGEPVQPLDFINPQSSSLDGQGRHLDLARLTHHFRSHNVLVVGSVARRIVWNTPELARLRIRIHAALKPSARVEQVSDHIDTAMRAFSERKGFPTPAYISIQLPFGPGWSEYCRQELAAVTSYGGEPEHLQCDMPPEAVAHVLEERRLGLVSRMLYVSPGTFNLSQLDHLHKQRFIVVTRERFSIDIHPDLGPAVDLAVCHRSSLFVGNMYSSFSFLLREAKLAAGESERASYYNLPEELTFGDLSHAEAARWDVLPLGTAR